MTGYIDDRFREYRKAIDGYKGPTSWRFIVPGKAVPKQRPRFARGRVYTAPETKAYEALVKRCALDAMPEGWPIRAYYECSVHVAQKRYSDGDGDNYRKAVLDALNGVAWIDDNRVISGFVTKPLAKADPYCIVRVRFCKPFIGAPCVPSGKDRSKK